LLLQASLGIGEINDVFFVAVPETNSGTGFINPLKYNTNFSTLLFVYPAMQIYSLTFTLANNARKNSEVSNIACSQTPAVESISERYVTQPSMKIVT
jgi:hypothetical protein